MVARRLVNLTVLVAASLVACGETSSTPTPTGGGNGGQGGQGGQDLCPAPGRLVDGECRTPGQQDDGCWAGEWLVDDVCVPAGMPPTDCPVGFEVAGDRCVAILSEPCPEGLMAPPGETECRPPMACGAGKWGDIPVENDTLYVDGSYTGGSSDGTETHPYVTVQAAISAAPEGTLIAVAAGTYGGMILVGKPLRVWGVCPEQVTFDHASTLSVILEGDQTELHGVTVRNGGLVVGEATGVLIDGVHVIDTPNKGVIIGGFAGATEPAEATIRSTLIEGAVACGLISYSSQMEVEGCEIRDIQADYAGRGYGIGMQTGLLDARATAVVRTTRIHDTVGVGVHTTSADLHAESLVVHDTWPNPEHDRYGYGLAIQSDAEGSVATLDGLHIRGAYGAGLFSMGSEVDVAAATIEDIVPQLSDAMAGGGIVARSDAEGRGSAVSAGWCFIEQAHEAGAIVSDSDLTMTGCVIRATGARPDGDFGHGVSMTGAVSSFTLAGSVIEDNTAMGVQINGGAAQLIGTVLRATGPSAGGLYGDGVVLAGIDGQPTLQVTACLLSGNARAGLSAFGAAATVGDSLFDCNPIAMVTDAYEGSPASIHDGGGNLCGCGDQRVDCKVQGAQLDPPLPLPPPPEDVPGLD